MNDDEARQAFGAAVVGALAATRPDLQPHLRDDGRIGLRHGALADFSIGLENHYRLAQAGQPLPDILHSILGAVDDVLTGHIAAGEWPAMRDKLRLQLMRPDHLDYLQTAAVQAITGRTVPAAARALVTWPWQDRLRLALVIDLPNSITYVSEAQLADWDRDPATARAVAERQTVRALALDTPHSGQKQGWRLTIWAGPNAATRLALPDLWRQRGRRTAVLVAPTRDLLVEMATTRRRALVSEVLGFLAGVVVERAHDPHPLVIDSYFLWTGADPERVSFFPLLDERDAYDGRGGPEFDPPGAGALDGVDLPGGG